MGCLGKSFSYFTGIGIAFKESYKIDVMNNEIHHCPGSAIWGDLCDNVTISNNVVYGNIWWTTSGSSAIVFAESHGKGYNVIDGNIVYGNRNFMLFFLATTLEHFGSGVKDYGMWNQSVIVMDQEYISQEMLIMKALLIWIIILLMIMVSMD